MIKGMLASNASKLVAACVCPVAGTVAVTVGVPQVRQAVHHATAPRAYALPKTRVRRAPVVPAIAPVPSIQTAAIAAPPCQPIFETAALTADFNPTETDITELAEVGDLPRPRRLDTVTPDAGLPALPGVPEPRSWVQMLIGFGLIGGAARYSLRHSSIDMPTEVKT